jgi:hypothetical protein
MSFAGCDETSGGGAWVLWIRTRQQTAGSSGWHRAEAFPSYSRCWKEISASSGIAEPGSWSATLQNIMAKPRHEEKSPSGGTLVWHAERESHRIPNGVMILTGSDLRELVCLPAGISP